MTKRIYIAATGAGAGAQKNIWETPGCSAYFAGATFPYGPEQLADFIGYAPTKSVCPEVAIDMAMRAYYTAYRGSDEDVIGIGCTAAVATNRERRGDSVAWVARVDSTGVAVSSRCFKKDVGTDVRISDGSFVDDLIILATDRATDAGFDGNYLATQLLMARPFWKATGERGDASELRRGQAIYPGAFDPAHKGHLAIQEATVSVFSIETKPPHKGSLSVAQTLQRLKGLRGRDVLLTHGLSLNVDKSNAFPNHPIVMGADAAIRMFDPRWGPTPEDIKNRLNANGTRLKIFGRMIGDEWVSAYEAIKRIPMGVVADPIDGRWDISSSQLRSKN